MDATNPTSVHPISSCAFLPSASPNSSPVVRPYPKSPHLSSPGLGTLMGRCSVLLNALANCLQIPLLRGHAILARKLPELPVRCVVHLASPGAVFPTL
ncbi:hypothetical protein LX32DRAFT_43165 [Colletotrichum zoysiae]|uniref:Uncharacterized protein n=1 Tax=Colletotrichum zoysiae TaxID=1216348 RepID=A0AAD9M6M3_9PEZI|nr:hypothetical protein LX32DRAFT_43165 [Colletotrichum zoysiae]